MDAMHTVVRYRGPTNVRNPEHDKIAAEYTLRVCEDKPIRVITKTSDIRPATARVSVLPFPTSNHKASQTLDEKVYSYIKERKTPLSTSDLARELVPKHRTVSSACDRLFRNGLITRQAATARLPVQWTI